MDLCHIKTQSKYTAADGHDESKATPRRVILTLLASLTSSQKLQAQRKHREE